LGISHFLFSHLFKIKKIVMKTILKIFAPIVMAGSLMLSSCKKEIENEQSGNEALSSAKSGQPGHLKQAKTFSSDVVRSWINMQLTMFRLPLPAGTGTQGTDRAQAYSGIALYEAVVPGMPAYQSLAGQLNGLPEMPATERGMAYHWAASANAALAEMSRRLFPGTAAANKTAIDNLEATLLAGYADEADAATLARSAAFGKEVAKRVFTWADADGWEKANGPYSPPAGEQYWVLTNPAAAAVNPYAEKRRLIVAGSTDGSTPLPLPAFSSDPSSPFYAMVKEVYDARNGITPTQAAMSDYFKDNPGYGPGGGFVWILQEAIGIAQLTLDQAAVAYAKVGMAQNDATIALFTDKYKFLTIRPITYIRRYINPTWNTYIPTPNHPEFPSGHATTNGAVLEMMRNVFGDHFPMTLHTYDYLNILPSTLNMYPPRHYETFTQMGLDMADSRFYGGLHYKETCIKSIAQGKKVANNILNTVHFLKE
jgi:hypothetical protein